MRAIDCVQGSADWLTARCGKITGSRMSDVLAKLKKSNSESAARATYKMELVAERLTGSATRSYVSPEMEWGTMQEPFARAAYEVSRGADVEQVGFAVHPIFDWAGASPDGLVGKSGLIEIKCPKTITHLCYLRDRVPPEDYVPQMMWAMACTGREWCDFISYDPRLPSQYQLFVVRLLRNDELILSMEKEVSRFNDEVNELLDSLAELAVEDPLMITEKDIA